MLRVCCECAESEVCVGGKAGGGSGEGGGRKPLANTLKSTLMNIKKAFGSRQLGYKFANQRNVSVCAAKGLGSDIN